MKRMLCLVLALLLTLSVLPGAGRGKISAGGVPEIKGTFSRVEISDEGILDFDPVKGADGYSLEVDGAYIELQAGQFYLKENVVAWIQMGDVPNSRKHVLTLRAYKDTAVIAQWESNIFIFSS